MKLKQLLLKNTLSRNILFFLFNKKVNRKRINKKIDLWCKNTKSMIQFGEKKNLIVCLTSFPARIEEVQYAVFSMMNQTVLPEKIILWLANNQFKNGEKDLPERLLSLKGDLFEIRWCNDLRSYKKLIPAIEQFKGKDIVICDDDIFYRKNTLKYLLEGHKERPDDVICHIGKEMVFDEKCELLPYEQWGWGKYGSSKKTIMPIGGGTVYYPATVLQKSNLLLRKDLFSELAFYADDVWFWFSIVSAGFSVSIPKHTYTKMIYTNPEREYGINDGFTLAKVNEGENLNDKQIKNIERAFGKSIKQLIEVTI